MLVPQDELSIPASDVELQFMEPATPTLREPAWKKPTRPCPFYSQGKCLFSDTCSFLHDVKIKVRRASDAVIPHEPRIIGNPPLLTGVNTSPGSPSRSPRMTSLLLALKDVIGEDQGGDNEGVEHVVEEPSPEHRDEEHQDILVPEVVPDVTHPVEESETVSPATTSPPVSGCSPKREDSIDSGYGDGFQLRSPPQASPQPSSQSRPSSINLLASPFAGSPSVRVFYPNMARGSLYSPHSPFASSLSEAALSPSNKERFSGYFSRRHSQDPDILASSSSITRNPDNDASHSKEELGSSSDSSLSSLDTLPPSPSDPEPEVLTEDTSPMDVGASSILGAQQPWISPEADEMLQTADEDSPLIPPGEHWKRSRASSDLTIMARHFEGGSYSPTPEVEELTDEAADSVYKMDVPSTSDPVWSPPVATQNFSRPSSIYSFHEIFSTVSPPQESSPRPSLGSPFQQPSPNRASVSSALNLDQRKEEPSGTKVPFGFRGSKRQEVSRRIPPALDFAQRPSSSLSLRSSDFVEPPSASALRPLRLSTILTSPAQTPSSGGDLPLDSAPVPPSPSSSVLSGYSISNNRLLSSARSSVIIPEHVRNTLASSNALSPLILGGFEQTNQLSNFGSPSSVALQSPITNNPTLQASSSSSSLNYGPVSTGRHRRTSSRLSTTIYPEDKNEHQDEDETDDDLYDPTIRYPVEEALEHGDSISTPGFVLPSGNFLEGIAEESVPVLLGVSEPARDPNIIPGASRAHSPPVIHKKPQRSRPVSRATSVRRVPVPVLDEDEFPHSAPAFRPTSAASHHTPLYSPRDEIPHTAPIAFTRSPIHAIATPRPTLMFAIASDNVEEVERVLGRGEAGPNDQVGPQSALEFALTNDQLLNKMEIVKTLLAYGADPSAFTRSNPASPETGNDSFADVLQSKMDPATKYFVNRADAVHTRKTSALIHRSFFRPLTRMRYDVIGQDCAFEQLFRVLSMHSQNLSVTPVVVLLCGPSGHGKSLVARKFGSLLDVPTHTVNMTTLRSTHDLWQSYSMDPYEEPSESTLAEFLTENEGKRCVVVLDEIDKVVDEKALWSLLMPWELGRCSFEAGRRHVNVRNVIWLGTANIGHELVFEHQLERSDPESPMSRQEYIGLVELFRPDVSKCLGPSLLSRVTTVLPFIPFTTEEKMAIATQALYALGKEMAQSMSAKAVENLVSRALDGYLPPEGARSLYRAVSTQLLEALDSV